mmetsp:Transcript_9410/g.28626  ORF Transcript_9410/g.28626 Transcript_9410/m.28626 type:complete len:182 (+) Transcript_9410:1219-1764(+)
MGGYTTWIETTHAARACYKVVGVNGGVSIARIQLACIHRAAHAFIPIQCADNRPKGDEAVPGTNGPMVRQPTQRKTAAAVVARPSFLGGRAGGIWVVERLRPAALGHSGEPTRLSDRRAEAVARGGALSFVQTQPVGREAAVAVWTRDARCERRGGEEWRLDPLALGYCPVQAEREAGREE